MSDVQSCTDLLCNLNNLFQGQRSTFGNLMSQAVAIDVLHHHIDLAVIGHSALENHHDIAVMNAPRRGCFILEPLDNFGIFRTRATEHLKSYTPASDAQLLCQIDLAHSAFAEHTNDVVVPYNLLAQRKAGAGVTCIHSR